MKCSAHACGWEFSLGDAETMIVGRHYGPHWNSVPLGQSLHSNYRCPNCGSDLQWHNEASGGTSACDCPPPISNPDALLPAA
jgi:hypothetical protein